MEERIKRIIEILEQEYPGAKSTLKYQSPFQMLIATVLSAQTMDETVNRVTSGLFKRYKTVYELAEAPLEEIQNEIRCVNFYKNKGTNIKKIAQIIAKDFNGEVPDSMEKLVSLPGVARKTANVVLGEVFGKAEGIVVDTHVKRLSLRLGLTDKTSPEKIEKDLMKLIPREKWISFPMTLILHGRKVCTAKQPKCGKCKIEKFCLFTAKTK